MLCLVLCAGEAFSSGVCYALFYMTRKQAPINMLSVYMILYAHGTCAANVVLCDMTSRGVLDSYCKHSEASHSPDIF